jgi:hypothetical protein
MLNGTSKKLNQKSRKQEGKDNELQIVEDENSI